MNVTGAVLCGGASRRMGRDKALIEVDGVMMAERVAQALAAGGCAEVVFVGGNAEALAVAGRRTFADEYPGEGPLGGLLTALHAVDGDVLLAACDLPALTAAGVRAVLEIAAGHPRPAAVTAVSTRREPLLSWWSAEVAPALVALWVGGTRAVHEALDAVGAVPAAVPVSCLQNANTPSDLPGG